MVNGTLRSVWANGREDCRHAEREIGKRMRRKSWSFASSIVFVAGLSLVLCSFTASSAVGQAPAQDFKSWIEDLHKQAASEGIGVSTLDSILPSVERIPRVIELDRNQPEFKLTLQQYLNRVVPRSRVQKGKRKLQENITLLTEIGRKYGVQPRFIVAFWGVETDFGRVDGGFPVIDALATLAYDGRRSKFFRGELIRALRIIDQGHITYANMKGSWAGAMGQFQFIPSSFERFAVDHDGDGRRDIWRNRRDAFASAANYLSGSGWKVDETWGREIKLPTGFNEKLAGLKIRKSLAEWQSLGVRRLNGRNLPTRDLEASIVLPEGIKGRAYLVYDNFRTTLKWNRSNFYAIAIGTLADHIGR